MNTVIWIMQGMLAAFFLMPVFMKLTSSKQKLIDRKMLETGGSPLPVRAIGTVDLLAAVGIIIPLLTGILPILTPVAAIGICLVMTGAVIVHSKRKEYKIIPLLVAAFILAVIVADYRFSHLQ